MPIHAAGLGAREFWSVSLFLERASCVSVPSTVLDAETDAVDHGSEYGKC
jgi:hypothetical protein